MTTQTMPYRPRLVETASIRRYRLHGQWRFSLHDEGSGEVLEVEERTATMLLQCDGTRDLGGILLATAQRGAYRRGSAIEAQLQALHARGLLADGLPPSPPSLAADDTASMRPLESLPDYLFHCSIAVGQGACCSQYPSYAFTDADRRRLPAGQRDDVFREDELHEPATFFLPLVGSVNTGLHGVALVDGHCALLQADKSCSIHAQGGAAAKPVGCSIFPRSFVDDGIAVRLSPFVECGCVLASVGGQEGESLQASEVRTRADLPAAVHVWRLEPTIRLHGETRATAAELHSWSATIARQLAQQSVDGVAFAWSLAKGIEQVGLSLLPVGKGTETPTFADLAPLMSSLESVLQQRLAAARGWRSDDDRQRLALDWLGQATRHLQEPKVVDGCLKRRSDAHETFYLRAILFGHQWTRSGQALAQALRESALRLLLARSLRVKVLPHVEPAQRAGLGFPLTLVEALLRAQGLLCCGADLP